MGGGGGDQRTLDLGEVSKHGLKLGARSSMRFQYGYISSWNQGSMMWRSVLAPLRGTETSRETQRGKDKVREGKLRKIRRTG